MSNEDRGQLIFFILIVVLPVSIFFIYTISIQQLKEQVTKFEIVDQYESCKVIKYTDTTQRWHYFLQCP